MTFAFGSGTLRAVEVETGGLLAVTVASTLNDTLILKIAIEFDILLKAGELPDKNVLALAIAQQFLEIARGNGEAENVVAKLYHGAFCFEDFSEYIKKSWDKYSKMKTLLYTSSEHSFYDFFVCNDIRPLPMSFHNLPSNELIDAIENGEFDESHIEWEKTLQLGSKNRGVIKSVTMKKLADVSRYTLLVGMGGIGKSMMMRHLFLTSNKEYSKTGILPILVILREFNSESTNLRNMIVDSVKRFDPSFSLLHLEDILSTGKCQLLLDGLDEIKSTDINEFLKQLDVLVDQHPDNQIVMSTRRFDSFIKLSRFNIMEMMTFKREQSLQLIDKLEYCPEEPKLKAQFREKLISDYFNMLAAMAQEESHALSRRMRWALDKRAEKGERKNRKAFGYDVKNGELVPNRDAKIVKEIFKLYAGNHPVSEISEMIAEKYEADIQPTTIIKMLKNEIYVGDRHIQKNAPQNYMTKKPDETLPYDSYYVTENHKGIVSRNQWDKVQQRLSEPKRKRNSHFMFGTIYCAQCGKLMLRKIIPLKGQSVPVWKCSQHIKNRNLCPQPYIQEDALMESIRKQMHWNAFHQKAFADKIDRVDVGDRVLITMD